MSNQGLTDYNILAREDGSTSYVVVGMQRVFQHIMKSEEFEQRFESLDHVVNAIMETVEDTRTPRVHSTLLAYTRNEDSSAKPESRHLEKKVSRKEVFEHLPAVLRSYIHERLPGSNVTTIVENDNLVGYRTINQELPYLVSVLQIAVSARKRGEKYDAVLHRTMRDAEPPISY
ncbi:MAG: hypothetical protein AB3N33_11900 [Puniceicoccaceae bacterium]